MIKKLFLTFKRKRILNRQVWENLWAKFVNSRVWKLIRKRILNRQVWENLWTKFVNSHVWIIVSSKFQNSRAIKKIRLISTKHYLVQELQYKMKSISEKRKFLADKKLPSSVKFRHGLIMSRWQTWWFPTLCIVPYILCLIWLAQKDLYWICQIMLAPFLMGGVLALLTIWLAKQEFRTISPKKK